MKLRDDLEHIVTVVTTRRDGREDTITLIGSAEKVGERIADLVQNRLAWGETQTITLVPTNPFSIDRLGDN